jgi:hypothetical protein
MENIACSESIVFTSNTDFREEFSFVLIGSDDGCDGEDGGPKGERKFWLTVQPAVITLYGITYWKEN